MRLDYHILWFEDNLTAYNIKKEFVRDIISEFGFNYIEPRREVNGRNIDTINFDQYDLIIADMNLANGDTGMSLMTKIRDEKNIFTEVIFYSSDGEEAVRAELARYRIDGAYCSGRENDDFENKAKEVIRTLIKKVQDLNNMRGLVMAETSDCDKIMADIISNSLKNDAQRDALSLFIYNHTKQKIKEKYDKQARYHRNNRIDKIIADNLIFDSDTKVRCVQFCIDQFYADQMPEHIRDTFYNNYRRDIITPRNKLAHIIEHEENGCIILKGTDDFIFNDDMCCSIRICLKKHKRTLIDIQRLTESN